MKWLITKCVDLIEVGVLSVRSNTRLLLVVILIFVFPLLFVWINQSFLVTAYKNIDTAEKQRISTLHDAVQFFIASKDSANEHQDFLETLSSANSDITKFRILEDINGAYKITSSIETELIGIEVVNLDLYRTAIATPGNSFIFEFNRDGNRVWQVFRNIRTSDNRSAFIFSEHDFSSIDSVMDARQQESYLGLTAIFLFIIMLAIWLARQVHWFNRYETLAETMRETELYIGIIVHELRAPLTAIRGYASLLQESGNISADDKRRSKTIQSASERMLQLVSDFLEVSRIQAGHLKLKTVTVDLAQISKSVVNELQGLAAEKNLQLLFSEPTKVITLETDAKRLTQVLSNVVTNSIKYTEKGTVTIEIKQSKIETSIKVKDTGTGISAADQKKLFSPFVRVGNVDQSSTTGTGLGMWTTKKLVEALGGTIGIESIEGVGTHVVITFKQ